jgi:hypothetical protein
MRKTKRVVSRAAAGRLGIVLAMLATVLLSPAVQQPPIAFAGGGQSVTIPWSDVEPSMGPNRSDDCESAAFAPAAKIPITVSVGVPTPQTLTISTKVLVAGDGLWLCFPFPNQSFPKSGCGNPAMCYEFNGDLVLYVDRDNDGGAPEADDFKISIPIGSYHSGVAHTWDPGSRLFTGPDPGGWSENTSFCLDVCATEVEHIVRIDRTTLPGWRRTIGLVLEYHESGGRSFLWPASAATSDPQSWGSAVLGTPELTVPASTTAPTVDGDCDERATNWQYGDATTTLFPPGPSARTTAYLKHTDTDLYICIAFLKVPVPGADTTASVFLNRLGQPGVAPSADDIAFNVSYSGAVSVHQGSGSGYGGPDPLGYTIVRRQWTDGTTGIQQWDAEFRISRATLGGGWDRDIAIALAQQAAATPGDVLGWPSSQQPQNPSTWGVAHLIVTTAPSGIDLRPTAIEVTQTVQDVDNSVPLIAGKRTFARVYVATNAPVTPDKFNITTLLWPMRNGQRVGNYALYPVNGLITLNPDADRSNIDGSYLFEIPVDLMTEGDISFEADVNPFHDPPESNYSNNQLSTGRLSVVAAKPFTIRILKYCYEVDGAQLCPTDTDLDLAESELRRMYPISALNAIRKSYADTATDGANTFGGQLHVPTPDQVANKLPKIRRDLEPGLPGSTLNQALYYAIYQLPPGVETIRGIAFALDGVASGIVDSKEPNSIFSTGRIAAHEIGHLLFRGHVNCPNTEPMYPDLQYPYPDGVIGGPAENPARYVGFDAGDPNLASGLPRRVVPPTATDIMSYCGPWWISDYTYRAMHDRIELVQGAQPPISESAASAPADYVSVSGGVDLSTNELQVSVTRQSFAGSVPTPTPGPFHIRLLGEAGDLLADVPFTPRGEADGGPHAIIDEMVPQVAGTQRVEIYLDTEARVLQAFDLSPSAPVIDLETPATLSATGAPLTLAWSASDPDGDALQYTVLYSRDDRSTWSAVSTTSDTQISIDPGALAGTAGPNSGYLRVVASDGTNNSAADLGPFTIENKPPVARIVSPLRGSAVVYGGTLSLEGSGVDPEDGTLPGQNLEWTSSLDGELGTGGVLHPRFLSAGNHVITLRAVDANGATGTATVDISVVHGNIGSVVRDTTPPVVQCAPPGQDWQSGSAPAACTASDDQSGLANPGDAQIQLSSEVPNQTETTDGSTSVRNVCDNAGNCALAGPVDGNRVDRRAPDISLGTPATNAEVYVLGQVAPAQYDCVDEGSGVAACSGSAERGAPIATDSVGVKTFTVKATDAANNQSQRALNYLVHYAAPGEPCLDEPGHVILPPISPDGSSTFPLGGTVQARFRVCDAAGRSVDAPDLVREFRLIDSPPPSGQVAAGALPDQQFRWDPLGQQWLTDIPTAGLEVGATYRYQVVLNDGTSLDFSFSVSARSFSK